MACNETDFGRLLKAILTAYPNFKALREPGAAEMWFRMLKQFEYTDLSRALEAHMFRSKFPPTLAEITAAAKKDRLDRLGKYLAMRDMGRVSETHEVQIREKEDIRRFDSFDEMDEMTGGNYTISELEYVLLRQADYIPRAHNLPEIGTTKVRDVDTWDELEGNYSMAELENVLLKQAERLHRHENESLRTAALIESKS